MERRGTLPYLPPEAIGNKQGGLPSDLWALGVVLFMTLGGYHPFDNKGESDLKQTSIATVSAAPDFDLTLTLTLTLTLNPNPNPNPNPHPHPHPNPNPNPNQVSAAPDFDDPIWAGVSTQARHLLNGLLNKDPSERLTIEQL